MIKKLFLAGSVVFQPLHAGTDILPQVGIDPQLETRSPLSETPARFGILYGDGAESDDSGSNFSWQQLTLQGGFLLNTKISDEFRLFYGPEYKLTLIDQGNFPMRDRLDPLHSISFPITGIYQRENSKWNFLARVSGELNSDLERVTSDDFDLSALLAAEYQFSDRFSVNFGVARSQNFGEALVIPAAGFNWKPNDRWAFSLNGPRITLSHQVNENLILRGGGFPMGGLWNVEEDGGESVDYGFSSYNVGLGLDYKLRHGIWLSFWGGTNYFNELRAETTGGKTLFKDDLDSGFFGYLGIHIYEW